MLKKNSVLILIIFCMSVSAKGNFVKIFWWNIQAGQTNQRLQNDPLNSNIESLLLDLKKRPDIFILGEYTQNSLNERVHSLLNQNYQCDFSAYNDYHKNIGILSCFNQPFELLRTDTLLDRRYHLYSYQGLYISPIHFSHDWHRYGKLKILKALLMEKNHPVYHQALSLRKLLENDFLTQKFSKLPLIILGDFNTPFKILNVKSSAMRILTKDMRSAMKANEPTFPAKKSENYNHYPQIQIDHFILTSFFKRTLAKKILFEGSDHYPIYGVFEY